MSFSQNTETDSVKISNLELSLSLCCPRLFVVDITLSQILDSSKPKEFADDNFKFDENGKKLSKQVEKTVGKVEIARYEQCLLFPQCFQKTCTADTQTPGLVWERLKYGGFFPPSKLATRHVANLDLHELTWMQTFYNSGNVDAETDLHVLT